LPAVATIIGGPLAGLIVTVAVQVGYSTLSPKPKSPELSREAIDRLNASIDPRAFRKFAFGETALSTDIRDHEYTGDQEYLHRFIVVASHKIKAVNEIWFDDKLAWTLAGGVQGEYVGYLTVAPVLEGNAGNAINISPRMGSSRRFTGLAYVHFRYKLTGNGKKTDSPFAQNIPTRMTIKGEGAFVYDPRLDSTVPGGSGPQRADDQSTWTTAGMRNPALQLLWWFLGWRINGLLAVGKGVNKERINMERFIIAANACDELVELSVGGFEPRYRSDQVFSEGDSNDVIRQSLLATMNADLDDVDGALGPHVFYNDLAFPIANFNDDHIIGDFDWRPTVPLNDSFNVVRGSYTDPSDMSLFQPAEYPQVDVASSDGIERVNTFDLPGVQSISQAQRLAKQRLQRQLFGGTFSTTLNAAAWKVQKNDVVTISTRRLGWTNKLFRLMSMEHSVDGRCAVVLREEHPSIYAWDKEESPAVIMVPPTVYNFNMNAVNLDLNSSLVTIIAPPAHNIYANSSGMNIASQFPIVLKPMVTRFGVDIRTSDETTYSIATNNVTATINNTTGNAEKGWINVTDGADGYIELTVTVSGVPYGPYRIPVTRVTGIAPSSGANGGVRTVFASTNSGSFVDMFTPPIIVPVAMGQTVTLSAPLSYNIYDPTFAEIDEQIAALQCKWQRSPAGAGMWTDIAPTTTGSLSTLTPSEYSGSGGNGNYNASDAPAAGSYDYKLVGRMVSVSGNPELYVYSGQASAMII
jgi:hypothetical protein